MKNKQPGDHRIGLCGNARQRRKMVRAWARRGYFVLHSEGSGQIVLGYKIQRWAPTTFEAIE
jgi:hypothetical protein